MAKITKQLEDENRSLKDALFSKLGISGRTDLQFHQIESVNKAETLSIMFGNEVLDFHLDNFKVLLQSLDRKSRNEFVESKKTHNTEAIKNSGKIQHLIG